MIGLFTSLKLQHILIITGLALGGFSVWSFSEIVHLKGEKKRVEQNFKNALERDSLETVIYMFRKQSELENIINQNENLKKMVEKSEVSLKRIQGLYYQELKVNNTEDKSYDVSEMVDSIINNISITRRWEDSTKCQKTKGYVSYSEGDLKVGVDSRESTNNITLIKHEGRKARVKWLLGLRLGKREIKFTPESDCGEIKVTVIDKVD